MSSAQTHGVAACGDSVAATATGRSQVSFARAWVGGQDVVHVTLAGSRKTPFMDVRASDLLISYVYDLKGRLIDRKIWFEKPKETRNCWEF